MARPEKPIISREKAATEALKLIDKNGLEALSLANVAKAMGVKAPSLYHHFKDKAEILSEVALLILRTIEAPNDSNLNWEEMLTNLCVATRRQILTHPNAAPLLLEHFPRHILLTAYNYWTGKCPYPPHLQMIIIEGTEKLTFGSALFEAAARAQGVQPMPAFDAQKYPDLAVAIASNTLSSEQMFAETIRYYLAGFRAEPSD